MEVAVLVFRIDPPVTVRPADDARPTVERPPEKVEVAVLVVLMVLVALIPATERFPEITALLLTERSAPGDDVPRPSRELESMTFWRMPPAFQISKKLPVCAEMALRASVVEAALPVVSESVA